MRGALGKRTGQYLSLVPITIPRCEKERKAPAVPFDVEEQIQQCLVILELLCVALLECRPPFSLVAVPGAQFGARRDVAHPKIEMRHGMAHTPWP